EGEGENQAEEAGGKRQDEHHQDGHHADGERDVAAPEQGADLAQGRKPEPAGSWRRRGVAHRRLLVPSVPLAHAEDVRGGRRAARANERNPRVQGAAPIRCTTVASPPCAKFAPDMVSVRLPLAGGGNSTRARCVRATRVRTPSWSMSPVGCISATAPRPFG